MLAGKVGLVVELLDEVEKHDRLLLLEYDLVAGHELGRIEFVLEHGPGHVPGCDRWDGSGSGKPLQPPRDRGTRSACASESLNRRRGNLADHVGDFPGIRRGSQGGLGPFSVYGAVGGKRRRKSSGRSGGRPSAAALERQAAAARRAQAEADKAREAQRLVAIFQEIISLHRRDFPPVERPVAPMPDLPDPDAVREWHEKNALRGIGVFDRARRAAARRYAAQAAQADLNDRWRQAQAEQAHAQQELDTQWARLTGNDPDTVLATLAEAFEDNEAPAAPVGIDGTELSLIVLVPDEDAVPERLPATTQAGNLTLRKLPKAERSALYLLLLAGHVLVTLREAFAVAPGVDAARVIAVRRSGPDIYGRPTLDCMVAGRWTRVAFNGVRWADADAGNILAGTATELVLNQKRGQILPVDLSTEPEIRDLLSTMDTADPATEA